MAPFRNSAKLHSPCARLWPMALIAAGVVLALVWARERDPFDRVWFALRTAEGARFDCVLVKNKASFRPGAPAVIYCHGSGGTLAGSGNDIRQIAQAGCAVLAIEYGQTNSSQFAAEIAAAHDWLERRSWVDTNRIVWAGMSLGAQELLSLTLNQPNHKPALLVRIVGGMVPKLDDAPAADNPSDPARKSNTNAHLDFPVLLFQAEADEVFPLASGQKVAERLRAAGTSVELITLPELTHRMEPDRAQVYRLVGEKILDALQRNH